MSVLFFHGGAGGFSWRKFSIVLFLPFSLWGMECIFLFPSGGMEGAFSFYHLHRWMKGLRFFFSFFLCLDVMVVFVFFLLYLGKGKWVLFLLVGYVFLPFKEEKGFFSAGGGHLLFFFFFGVGVPFFLVVLGGLGMEGGNAPQPGLLLPSFLEDS